MNLKGKKILVTGGAGFIGSHLVDMLLEDDIKEVIVFDNFTRGCMENLSKCLEDKRTTLFDVKGDLTHIEEIMEATQNVDVVFHMASLCLAYCQKYPRSAIDVNINGTYNLLDACVKNNVERIIFASSSSIYGNCVYSPMDENHPFENKNFYGATKIAGEAIFKAFCHKYGLSYLSLRYMNVYGPRQDYLGAYIAVIMRIIDKLQKGESPVVYGDGSQAFDFIYVKDACRATIMAMKSEHVDRAYNVCSGKQVSILDLCKTIISIMRKDIPIVFSPEDDPTLVTDRVGNTEKAEKELGFTAQISLEEGLKDVINWKLNQ